MSKSTTLNRRIVLNARPRGAPTAAGFRIPSDPFPKPSRALGSVVRQIAKIKGCTVVGVAGDGDKCRYVMDELGFDFCVDRRTDDLPGRLAAACPKGIDVYFENVGGAVFDAVLPLLNARARIPVCGLIAGYNATELPPGPDRLGQLQGKNFGKLVIQVA